MKKTISFFVIIYFSIFISICAADLDVSVYHDTSLNDCENNIPCSRLARWQCMAAACAQPNHQRPTDCYVNFAADKNVADRAICLAEMLPNEDNIHAVLEAIPGAKEADVVQGLMMMRAILGNRDWCQDGIKDYIASNDLLMTTFWESAMEGCHILSMSATMK